jgi:hypothetical protein
MSNNFDPETPEQSINRVAEDITDWKPFPKEVTKGKIIGVVVGHIGFHEAALIAKTLELNNVEDVIIVDYQGADPFKNPESPTNEIVPQIVEDFKKHIIDLQVMREPYILLLRNQLKNRSMSLKKTTKGSKDITKTSYNQNTSSASNPSVTYWVNEYGYNIHDVCILGHDLFYSVKRGKLDLSISLAKTKYGWSTRHGLVFNFSGSHSPASNKKYNRFLKSDCIRETVSRIVKWLRDEHKNSINEADKKLIYQEIEKLIEYTNNFLRAEQSLFPQELKKQDPYKFLK